MGIGSKYIFNPESLSFEKVRLSIKGIVVRVFTFFTASIVVAIFYYLLFARFFDSPQERMLRRENEQMAFQYKIMQDKLNQLEEVLVDLQERDDNIYRVIFESEPIPSTVRQAGIGGINRYENLEGYSQSKLMIELAKKMDNISKQAYVQSKSYDEVIELAKNKAEMLLCIPAIQPVSNKDLKRTASGYGMRIDPVYKIPRFHEGMDFTAPTGTDVFVTGNGVVESAERNYGGYGNCVVIDHGFGIRTLYGHLNAFNVRAGQKVSRGDIIGFVGNTGKSTGPHLHYEVIKNNKAVNPVNYYFNDLTPDQYERMIEISSSAAQSFD
ncbi:MAG: M23 family metallopeptidase [Bacteroidales bacterium]|nr:M23 family metallopeptidase [Bacteroidales bacterium]